MTCDSVSETGRLLATRMPDIIKRLHAVHDGFLMKDEVGIVKICKIEILDRDRVAIPTREVDHDIGAVLGHGKVVDRADVPEGAQVDAILSVGEIHDPVVPIPGGVDEGVGSGSAVEPVITVAAMELVVAHAAVKPVASLVAKEMVGSRTAVNFIVPLIAEKLVVARPAFQNIAAGTAFDRVIAQLPFNVSLPRPPWSSSSPRPPSSVSSPALPRFTLSAMMKFLVPTR